MPVAHCPRRRLAARALAAVTLAAGLSPVAVRAQDPAPAAAPAMSAAPASPYRLSVGGNPFAPIFGGISGEVEGALNPAFTLGLGGTADLSSGESRYTSLQAKVKYYPNEIALRGFSIGVTLGFVSARDEVEEGLFGNRGDVRSQSAATYGIVLDYNWLLGRQKRFLVGTGIGARRVLRDVNTATSPLLQYYPDGRLVVGWAF